MNRPDTIKRAASISLVGNALLAVLKIGAGTFAGSTALVGDGIDSSVDVLISIITLVVVKIVSKPADDNHPWGHGRAETVATAFLSFFIFFAGAQLIYNSALHLMSHDEMPAPPLFAMIVAGISIIGKTFLALTLYRLGAQSASSMLIANAKNMTSDVLVSAGVLTGLGISRYLNAGAADTIVAILVGIWVIKSAVNIFFEANLELMDGVASTESYQIVFDAVNAVEGAANPHRTRMRRIAGFWDIDMDIEVNPDLSVEKAHAIATQVEAEIKKRLGTVFDVVIHIEPQGRPNNRSDEGYGLSYHN
jgi:cation diffusion facilitator family transporter